MKPAKQHLEWAIAHRKSGTELRYVRGRYHLTFPGIDFFL